MRGANLTPLIPDIADPIRRIARGNVCGRGLSRRSFLGACGSASLGVAAGSLVGGLFGCSNAQSQEAEPARATPDFEPDLDVRLYAEPAAASLLDGATTRVWRYRAEVISGDADRVIPGGSYLGPTLRMRRGERFRVRFVNNIPEVSIVHWHGLIVPPRMDGRPQDVIPRGKEYVYEFEVRNRAGTYWYHAHPDERTGPQVYYGMAGLLLVRDEEEAALQLPDGPFELPLVIQDRLFDDQNDLVYVNGHMDRMSGFLGDRILLNGSIDISRDVRAGAYRLRLLNGSNSRIYRLAWSDGRPLTVIGTDGGLLEEPVERQSLLFAPGERVELWADFSDASPGDRVELISLPFDAGGFDDGRGGMRGRGGGMMGGGMRGRGRGMMGDMHGFALPGRERFAVARMRVVDGAVPKRTLPTRLATIDRYRMADAHNARRPRTFELEMAHMRWLINGRSFDMADVAPEERVPFGSLDAWVFVNQGGRMGMMGGMMQMPHPMHLHGVQFQVVERRNARYPEAHVDGGWQDTVLVMPDERVTVLARFDQFDGMYVYHCHNLEHEDMGMMRNYLIKKGA